MKKALCVGGPLAGKMKDVESEAFHCYEPAYSWGNRSTITDLSEKVSTKTVVYQADIIHCNEKEWHFYRDSRISTEEMIDELCEAYKERQR